MHLGDIDNFATTCRYLCLLSVDVVQKHQSWKTAYSHLSLRDCRPSIVLGALSQYESRIAYYHKKLTIIPDKYQSRYNATDLYIFEQVELMATEGRNHYPSEKIFSLLNSSGGRKVAGIITAILIRKLPNLETISYIEDSLYRNSETFAYGLIDGIMVLATSFSPPGFTRLSHLSITKVDDQVFPRGFQSFLRLLTLPTLRSFALSGFSCQKFNILPFHPQTSRVKKLDINLQAYSSKSMLTMLNAFKALKSFKLRIIQERL